FSTTGATSELPGKPGGLDPSAGVNLRYFVGKDGFTRPMVPEEAVPGKGLKWLGGLTTLTDPEGRERLVAKYDRVKGLEATLERGPGGRLVYGWTKGTPPLSLQQQDRLVKAKLLRPEETWGLLRDIDTGKPVKPHGGSVCWNPYRRRWVAVFIEIGGTSML